MRILELNWRRKLKYYKHGHTEILYRQERKKKKRRSAIRKRIRKYISVLIALFSLLAIVAIAALLFTQNSPLFNVKRVSTVISNDPDIVAPKLFNHLIGMNIFSVNDSSIDSIIREKSIHYGMQSVIRQYPDKLKIVLYRRIPVICINNKYTIYQDFSMKDIPSHANIIDMSTDIPIMHSPYDIPGFASIFASLIKQHDMIESISYRNGKYSIYTNNSVSIIMKPGNEFPEIDCLPEGFSYVDVRFRNTIYVKK